MVSREEGEDIMFYGGIGFMVLGGISLIIIGIKCCLEKEEETEVKKVNAKKSNAEKKESTIELIVPEMCDTSGSTRLYNKFIKIEDDDQDFSKSYVPVTKEESDVSKTIDDGVPTVELLENKSEKEEGLNTISISGDEDDREESDPILIPDEKYTPSLEIVEWSEAEQQEPNDENFSLSSVNENETQFTSTAVSKKRKNQSHSNYFRKSASSTARLNVGVDEYGNKFFKH